MTRRRRRSSINATRSILYTIAKLLGDLNAIQKGRVGKRVGRRVAGKQQADF